MPGEKYPTGPLIRNTPMRISQTAIGSALSSSTPAMPPSTRAMRIRLPVATTSPTSAPTPRNSPPMSSGVQEWLPARRGRRFRMEETAMRGA